MFLGTASAGTEEELKHLKFDPVEGQTINSVSADYDLPIKYLEFYNPELVGLDGKTEVWPQG